jgi:hypothetical protein
MEKEGKMIYNININLVGLVAYETCKRCDSYISIVDKINKFKWLTFEEF